MGLSAHGVDTPVKAEMAVLPVADGAKPAAQDHIARGPSAKTSLRRPARADSAVMPKNRAPKPWAKAPGLLPRTGFRGLRANVGAPGSGSGFVRHPLDICRTLAVGLRQRWRRENAFYRFVDMAGLMLPTPSFPVSGCRSAGPARAPNGAQGVWRRA